MRDMANKSWIRDYREPTEHDKAMFSRDQHTTGAIIGIVGMVIGFVMMVCAIILIVNKANPIDALDDCVLSPDMQSFISTSKQPVTLKLEDTQ
jgi:tetrahydromethanopterin S-methyltransferase subunit F